MKFIRFVIFASLPLLLAARAGAAFHIMQIEEVIGGVDGDPTAQAIQLRLRTSAQGAIGFAEIRAWDSNGQNPVVLLNLPTSDTVSNIAAGANILLTTAAFDTIMHGVAGYASDFTLTTGIPVSYLSGGKLTFEDKSGTVYWSVAFGNYTGTNTGAPTNGTFGSPFASPLPTATARGIHFTGAATAASVNNKTDYAFTTDPATVKDNAGASFAVVPEPGPLGLISLGVLGLLAAGYWRRRT